MTYRPDVYVSDTPTMFYHCSKMSSEASFWNYLCPWDSSYFLKLPLRMNVRVTKHLKLKLRINETSGLMKEWTERGA